MRPRKSDRHLPKCMYFKHGAYYLVRKGKWERLDTDYQAALLAYAKKTMGANQGGMPALIDKAFSHHAKVKVLAANTLLQYEQAATKLKEVFAEFEPADVMPRHVAAFKVSMADTPSMANRMLSFLRVTFGYALEWQLVDANPCMGIKPYTEQRRERYITDAEFGAILNASSEYMRQIWEMAYLTGQRISDVLAIKLSDISDEGIAFTQQKTGAKLIVMMTPDLEALIARARALPRKVAAITLFSSRIGTPVDYSTAKDAWARARKQAGVKDATIHDLRAKSLTDADREGKNAQTLGGHTDARMTARYLRGRLPKMAEAPKMPTKIR